MDYYEKCCQYQNIDYRYLIIYIRFQILVVSKSIVFFWWGSKLSPPYKTQIYIVWEMQSTGKCLKSNKVFTTQCLALNKVKRQDIRFTKQI